MNKTKRKCRYCILQIPEATCEHVLSFDWLAALTQRFTFVTVRLHIPNCCWSDIISIYHLKVLFITFSAAQQRSIACRNYLCAETSG